MTVRFSCTIGLLPSATKSSSCSHSAINRHTCTLGVDRPSHSQALPLHGQVEGSQWNAHFRIYSTPPWRPPGSLHSHHHKAALRGAPCWGGRALRWAWQSSAASATLEPAGSPDSLWSQSIGNKMLTKIHLIHDMLLHCKTQIQMETIFKTLKSECIIETFLRTWNLFPF